jgi:hypothetical protein
VPIIESGRITGQFRVVLKLVPQTPEDGSVLSAHQPAIQSILLSAANEYARLNVSIFRPVNVKTLRKLLLAAVRKPGHKVKDVLVIDASEVPRDKACGDGLTPRAVVELRQLGLGDWLDGRIRHHGLRLAGFGSHLEVRWPGPSFPETSSAVPRTELDDRVRKAAEDAGAGMLLGCKAVDVDLDSAGRVTAICTVVVSPTYTGSWPRTPPPC